MKKVKKHFGSVLGVVLVIALIVIGIVFATKDRAEVVQDANETETMTETSDTTTEERAPVIPRSSFEAQSDTEVLADIESDLSLDELDDLDFDNLGI